MIRLASFATALLLLFGADNPPVLPWRTNSAPQPDVLAGARIPILPDFQQDADAPKSQGKNHGNDGGSSGTQDVRNVSKKDGPLDSYSELALVRYVDGEYAHAVKSLPSGKEGLIIHAGKPVSDEMLQRALFSHGAAVNPGDPVQITALQFKKTQIYVLLNGGGKRKTSWRDRIQVGIMGLPTASVSPDNNGTEPSAAGSTIILDFGGPIPNMTPDEMKQMLAPVLNFSKERSSAVQWSQTLPPEMQKAITEKRAIVGMTREMVEAAIGKPDKKVRERNLDGDETEDWIYGQPPAITVFVTFIGEKVTRVEQFPRDHIASP